MYPDITIKNVRKNSILYKKGLSNITDNIFMSDKRKRYIIKNFKYLFTIKYLKNDIYLFLENKKDITKWNNTLQLIVWRIECMRYLFNNNKKLELWIIPTKYKKEIPKNKIITPDVINSGSCYIFSENENGIIMLWRKEELLKVLLHELCHSFKLDRKYIGQEEVYAEYYALLLHINLELIERGIYNEKKFNELLEVEKEFSIEQSKKTIQCINNRTNIFMYINEKSRLLHNIEEDKWDNFLKSYKIKKKRVSDKSLRFTITDIYLKKYPKKNNDGKRINV